MPSSPRTPHAPPPPNKRPPLPPLSKEERLRIIIRELFDTEHHYFSDLALIAEHLQKYKNKGIQINRQNIISESFNPILERATTYLNEMATTHNFTYMNDESSQEIQKNQKDDFIDRFLTLDKGKNKVAFQWLENITSERTKELYIKYSFIFEGFLLKDILQTNEESKQINKSRLDLNSFLIQPIQRYPRYKMLFDEAIKYSNDKEKEKFETYKATVERMSSDFNKFKIYFALSEFDKLYKEGQTFINSYLPNILSSFPFNSSITNNNHSMTEGDVGLTNAISITEDDEISRADEQKINDEISAEETKVENMKRDFLETIYNGVLASSIKKNKTNESTCRTNQTSFTYNIRAKLQSELDKLDKQPNETLFDVYIRVVNEKVVGDGCQDILMRLIVFEQASTFYIARCIKSKYPNSYFAIDKIQSPLSGLWKYDKGLLKKGDQMLQTGGRDDGGVEEIKGDEGEEIEGVGDVGDVAETHSPNKYEKYKENSMVYQLIKKQMSVNKEIVGFQPEITNLDEMFDFKQIDKIVKEFDTSDADQKRLSKYFDKSVKMKKTLQKRALQISKEDQKQLSSYFTESAQMKTEMDIKVLTDLAKKAHDHHVSTIHDPEEKEFIKGLKNPNFLVNIYKKKRYQLNYSNLYAVNDNSVLNVGFLLKN